MKDCSGHGTRVNLTCICEDGFSGHDLFVTQDDCHVNDVLVTELGVLWLIIAGILVCLTLRVFWVLKCCAKRGSIPFAYNIMYIHQLVFGLAGINIVRRSPVFEDGHSFLTERLYSYLLASCGFICHLVFVAFIWHRTLLKAQPRRKLGPGRKLRTGWIVCFLSVVMWLANVSLAVMYEAGVWEEVWTYYLAATALSWFVTIFLFGVIALAVVRLRSSLKELESVVKPNVFSEMRKTVHQTQKRVAVVLGLGVPAWAVLPFLLFIPELTTNMYLSFTLFHLTLNFTVLVNSLNFMPKGTFRVKCRTCRKWCGRRSYRDTGRNKYIQSATYGSGLQEEARENLIRGRDEHSFSDSDHAGEGALNIVEAFNALPRPSSQPPSPRTSSLRSSHVF